MGYLNILGRLVTGVFSSRMSVALYDLLTQSGRPSVGSLTVEVKGCWNFQLHIAMQSQLVDRYLASTGETARRP